MRGAGEVGATVDFWVKPVRGEGGEPAFLVAEGRDVTDVDAEAQPHATRPRLPGLTGGIASSSRGKSSGE